MNLSTETKPLCSIYSKQKKKSGLIVSLLIFTCFSLTITAFSTIIIYILKNGAGHLLGYLFSTKTSNSILPELINTIYVEVLALLTAVPTGIGAAIYITQYCNENQFFVKLINFSIEILASVPSVLFGMFGYSLFCITFGLRCSILAGSLTMAACVLPIVIQTTKQALKAVPQTFSHAALAVGASKLKTIFSIVLPCSTSGILTGIILAAGKIIGESAALILTIGTAAKLPSNLLNHIFSSGKTLSLHLYFTAGNSSSSDSLNICFATATVLLALTLILNLTANFLANCFAKT